MINSRRFYYVFRGVRSKLDNYTKETDISKTSVNRRFIELTSVRIRPSDKFKDRAEIVLKDGEILLLLVL